ncbi:hypothetical protein Cni_G06798 [Canna indica]|uniref:Reverse transcriptase domain-containing protein n=1 Tax=Canna indica TaxID=4628 RepID=A0AAQ3JXM8_9LILI|nr:hypothetical protein Cni_G06798 [Canna indica]
MLNGSPGNWFRYKKGLCQGHPLSPYLFLLMVDIFARVMRRENSEGTISGSEEVCKALVCWDDVTSPRHNGGLGILDLEKHNVARLGRWWWGLASGENLLWTHIISNLYFRRARWQANHNTSRWSAVWKGIYESKHLFAMGMESIVGRGNSTRFWLYRWIRNSQLADNFPHLYSLCRNKKGMIEDFTSPNANV